MKKISKYILILIISLSLLLCVSCKDQDINQEMNVGETIRLTSDVDCVWSSSDETVVTVNSEGIVKAISQGTAIIYSKTAKSEYEIGITVYEGTAKKIVVNTKQTLIVGEEVTLEPSVISSDDNYAFTYSTNDESVIKLTENKVQAQGIGLATVTIKAQNKQEILIKEILFYVYQKNDDGSIVTDIINKNIYEVDGSFDFSNLNERFTKIVEEYKESIIGVSNYQDVYDFFGRKSTVESGVGTGFVFKRETTSEGYLYYALTNYHVIESNKYIKAYFGYTKEYIDAEVLCSDSDLDLAVITFTSSKDLKVLELGDETSVSTGDFAIAIGNANGYQYFGTTTFGIISYVNRELEGETSVYLQHDVAINPGNSGGPLLDVDGKVIGINTLKIVESDVDNIGFAITIDTVKSFLEANNIKL